ncbi:MAG: diguanylate cyclase [Oceanospirillales bacterium]|nr:MAG: diguanylate cyclase [Oceanospirillales bacterium]
MLEVNPTKYSSAQLLLEASSEQLPAPKGVALSIMEACQDEDSTLQQISKLVQMDPSLSGHILKMANSASTGRRPVVAVPQAIVRVGMKTVGQLAVAFSLIGNESLTHCRAFNHQKYWTRCLLLAVLARSLTKATQIAPPEDIFACGLLARIGVLGLASIYPEAYSEILSKPATEQTLLEKEVFGISHNELSLAMMIDFCVPEALAVPTRYHEEPECSGFEPKTRPYIITTVLHLAYCLSEAAISDNGTITTDTSAIQKICSELKFEAGTIDTIFNNSLEEWREWSEIFQLKTDNIPEYQKLKFETAEQAKSNKVTLHADFDIVKPAIIEDTPVVSSLKSILSQLGLACAHCDKTSTAIQLAMNGQANVFFTSQNNHKFIDLLRGTKQIDDSYIFVVLDKLDNELETQAYRVGADDVITLNITAKHLHARLQPAIRMLKRYERWRSDQSELSRIARELSLSHRKQEVLALTDQLTELPNRRAAMEVLDKTWKLSLRTQKSFILVILDIDHFKTINDSFGHDIGDEVLKNVASILKKFTRGEDTIARIGGEEFLLISPNMPIREALIAAERLRQSLEITTLSLGDLNINVTTSIGVAMFEKTMQSKEDLIIAADKALYAAKHNGRNRIGLNLKGKVQMVKKIREKTQKNDQD